MVSQEDLVKSEGFFFLIKKKAADGSPMGVLHKVFYVNHQV